MTEQIVHEQHCCFVAQPMGRRTVFGAESGEATRLSDGSIEMSPLIRQVDDRVEAHSFYPTGKQIPD